MNERLRRSVAQCGLLVALVGLPACEPGPQPLSPSAHSGVEHAQRFDVTSQPAHVQLARAFALGMSQADARALILRSMRASKFNEHKLVLQDFVDTREGARFLGRVASVTGQDLDSLREIVEALPAKMDFYVPSDQHRRSWVGTGDVLVAGLGDPDADRALGFTPDGQVVDIRSPADIVGSAAFVLHPSEPKAVFPERDLGPGNTISEEGVETSEVTQVTIKMSSEDCGSTAIQECSEIGGGGGPSGTRVESIVVRFDDGGVFSHDNEIYFVATSPLHGTTESDTVGGIAKDEPELISLMIHESLASASNELLVQLWESDGGLNGGDDFEGEGFDPSEDELAVDGPDSYLSLDGFRPPPEDVRAEYTVTVNP